MELNRKIDLAIRLLQSIPQDGPIELSYSGGKDSDVILELAKMSGIPFEAIYKNTTIDPPGTIKHCKENGVTILNPNQTMFKLIEKNGWPSRWSRFCCRNLKEYKVYDRAIQGIRRAESTKRRKRYKEPEECRVYANKDKARLYFPILEWSNEDVEQFIKKRNIKCAPKYYDSNNNFHIERRLGCIGCPLASDYGRKDFIRYPKMLKLYIQHFSVWWEKHPKSKTRKRFNSVYQKVFYNLFAITKKQRELFEVRMTGGLFPEMAVDPKKFLEDYFKIEL